MVDGLQVRGSVCLTVDGGGGWFSAQRVASSRALDLLYHCFC